MAARRGLGVRARRESRAQCRADRLRHPDRNVFQITDEWRYKRTTVYANRADVVFLINGIPIAIAETKGTSKANGMEQGVTQIRRYHAFDSWAHLNQLLEDWLASEADQRCHGTLKEVGESRGERPRASP